MPELIRKAAGGVFDLDDFPEGSPEACSLREVKHAAAQIARVIDDADAEFGVTAIDDSAVTKPPENWFRHVAEQLDETSRKWWVAFNEELTVPWKNNEIGGFDRLRTNWTRALRVERDVERVAEHDHVLLWRLFKEVNDQQPKRGVTFYRGVDVHRVGVSMEDVPRLYSPGTVIETPPGGWTTSTRVADSFTRDVTFRVHGLRSTRVDVLAGGFRGEGERLAYGRFRVTNVEHTDRGRYLVDVEQLEDSLDVPFTERLHRLEEQPGLSRQLSGTHRKRVLRDPIDDSLWLFKPQERWRAELDVATSRLQEAAFLPAPETHVIDWGDEVGSVQRFLGDDLALDPDATPLASKKVTDLAAGEVRDLQRAGAFNWLIGNHDTHRYNFVRVNDQLTSVDHGAAWKWVDRDALDEDFVPPQPALGGNVIQEVRQAYARGEDVPGFQLFTRDEDLRNFVAGIGRLSNRDVRRIVEPYALAAAEAGIVDDASVFVSRVLARKNNIVNDFQEFHRSLESKRVSAVGEVPVTQQQRVRFPKTPTVEAVTDTLQTNGIDLEGDLEFMFGPNTVLVGDGKQKLEKLASFVKQHAPEGQAKIVIGDELDELFTIPHDTITWVAQSADDLLQEWTKKLENLGLGPAAQKPTYGPGVKVGDDLKGIQSKFQAIGIEKPPAAPLPHTNNVDKMNDLAVFVSAQQGKVPGKPKVQIVWDKDVTALSVAPSATAGDTVMFKLPLSGFSKANIEDVKEAWKLQLKQQFDVDATPLKSPASASKPLIESPENFEHPGAWVDHLEKEFAKVDASIEDHVPLHTALDEGEVAAQTVAESILVAKEKYGIEKQVLVSFHDEATLVDEPDVSFVLVQVNPGDLVDPDLGNKLANAFNAKFGTVVKKVPPLKPFDEVGDHAAWTAYKHDVLNQKAPPGSVGYKFDTKTKSAELTGDHAVVVNPVWSETLLSKKLDDLTEHLKTPTTTIGQEEDLSGALGITEAMKVSLPEGLNASQYQALKSGLADVQEGDPSLVQVVVLADQEDIPSLQVAPVQLVDEVDGVWFVSDELADAWTPPEIEEAILDELEELI